MSTIAEKLIRLNQIKADIKAAIEEKGQTVSSVAFSQYANKVRAIKGISPVTPSSASTTDVTGKLNRLTSTKTDIKSAIEACGVSVGSIPFSQYPDKIRAIQTKSTYTGTYSVLLDGGIAGIEIVLENVESANADLTVESESYDHISGFYTTDKKNTILELTIRVSNRDYQTDHYVNGRLIPADDCYDFEEKLPIQHDNQDIDVAYDCKW